jgi:oxygen-independent coproporphyrinogen-3 oxidase
MLFPGRHSGFTFTHQEVSPPPTPTDIDLYIHLPFCRRLCVFCPYVKQLYDADTATAYGSAIMRELQTYRNAWGEVPIRSVYFGGGTPSLTPDIVEGTLSWLAGKFHLDGEVGVEVHPLDTRPNVLRQLRGSGVTMASLGVQTFNDRLLAMLGRDYDAAVASKACERVLDAGFNAVDIDLIFALPGQSPDEAAVDVATACRLGVDQVSTYPLIQFSDTPLATYLRTVDAALPGWRAERRMLDAVVRQARDAGYDRSSIWSFNRPGAPRYTTVTRNAFVGIGAGATSMMGDQFRVNTFSVDEYIRATVGGSPMALVSQMNEGDRMAYWLFWRCYNTVIDTYRFGAVFRRRMPRSVRAALRLLVVFGLAKREGSVIRLTDSGAYLFHLVEKEYTHVYLETLWTTCRRDPWPESVRL